MLEGPILHIAGASIQDEFFHLCNTKHEAVLLCTDEQLVLEIKNYGSSSRYLEPWKVGTFWVP